MDFYAVLDQVIELLRSRGRVTYGALKLQFGLDDEQLSTRTKIFLCVTILSTFVDSQPSQCTTLINKKDMFTGAIYSKFKPRNSQFAP